MRKIVLSVWTRKKEKEIKSVWVRGYNRLLNPPKYVSRIAKQEPLKLGY